MFDAIRVVACVVGPFHLGDVDVEISELLLIRSDEVNHLWCVRAIKYPFMRHIVSELLLNPIALLDSPSQLFNISFKLLTPKHPRKVIQNIRGNH